jgi:hypothetical protein
MEVGIGQGVMRLYLKTLTEETMERHLIGRRPSRWHTPALGVLLAGLVVAACGEATSPSGDVQLQALTCAFSYQSNETGNESCAVSLAPTATSGGVSGVIESVEYVGPDGNPLPANHEVAPGLYVYSLPSRENLANTAFGPQPYEWTLYASTSPPVQTGTFTVKVRVTYRLTGSSSSVTLEVPVTVVVS